MIREVIRSYKIVEQLVLTVIDVLVYLQFMIKVYQDCKPYVAKHPFNLLRVFCEWYATSYMMKRRISIVVWLGQKLCLRRKF